MRVRHLEAARGRDSVHPCLIFDLYLSSVLCLILLQLALLLVLVPVLLNWMTFLLRGGRGIGRFLDITEAMATPCLQIAPENVIRLLVVEIVAEELLFHADELTVLE